MKFSLRRPIRNVQRCLTIAAIALPLAESFITPMCSSTSGRLITSSSSTSGPRRSTATASRVNAASRTLFSVDEEEALEQQGAGHLPAWDEIPFSETFDQLEGQLTR